MHEENDEVRMTNDETMTKPECRGSLDQLRAIFSSCERIENPGNGIVPLSFLDSWLPDFLFSSIRVIRAIRG
jgi:hypothetical protein